MTAPVERHSRVTRTARYYVIGEPSGARELWVACHGYGQLAAPFARALRPLAASERVVVVPEALNRFYLDDPAKHHGPDSPVGAAWMTREDREHEIADYVGYLDTLVSQTRGEIHASQVTVVALGFSQGVATVCRWAALGTTRIARLILWGGTLPQDLPADRGADLFRGAALLLVAGARDALVPTDVMDRERERLNRLGVRADLALHAGGHALNTALLRTLGGASVSSGA